MSTTNRTPYIFNEIEGKLATLFIKTKSILNNEAPNRINGVDEVRSTKNVDVHIKRRMRAANGNGSI